MPHDLDDPVGPRARGQPSTRFRHCQSRYLPCVLGVRFCHVRHFIIVQLMVCIGRP
ncbi:MAG TPA: hypothetical protein VGG64_15070 [Pirellulales bacterium]|jgi:hypothetical protein